MKEKRGLANHEVVTLAKQFPVSHHWLNEAQMISFSLRA